MEQTCPSTLDAKIPRCPHLHMEEEGTQSSVQHLDKENVSLQMTKKRDEFYRDTTQPAQPLLSYSKKSFPAKQLQSNPASITARQNVKVLPVSITLDVIFHWNNGWLPLCKRFFQSTMIGSSNMSATACCAGG